MASSQRENSSTVEVPAPTAWPMIAALGVSLCCAGLVTSLTVSAIGALLLCVGAVGWFRDVLPEQRCETLPLEGREVAVTRAKVGVAHLEVGEEGHRARLPIEIYPYTAGIEGGIAGGIVMAVLAVAYGIAAFGSPWYPINILAATVMSSLSTADVAVLSKFNLTVFVIATFIHAVVSVLVGLLYGVLLPMLPRRPIFFGGVVAPALWTGLLWASLKVINPVLDARIHWRWFIVCQVAYGFVAGVVVARSEKIATIQHLPFLMRAGIEAPGVSDHEAHE